MKKTNYIYFFSTQKINFSANLNHVAYDRVSWVKVPWIFREFFLKFVKVIAERKKILDFP